MRALARFAVAALIVFTTSAALAQPLDPAADPAGTANQFWAAVAHKQWGLAAVIATMLFVAFARFIAPKIHGKFGAWVNQTRVSAAFAFLGGALSALSLKLLAGLPWSTNLIGFGFAAGVAAIGGYNAFWDLLFPADKSKPKEPALELPPPIRSGGSAGRARFVVLMAIAIVGFVAACTMTGCVPGTDGLRQSCANANVTLSSATMGATAVYKVAHQEMRARLTKDNADATEALAKKIDTAFDKFIATMAAAAAAKKTTCDQADTIDAGIKKDVGALILDMIRFANDVAAAVMEFQKAIDTYRPVAMLLMEVA